MSSLGKPNGDPRDGFFYPTLTLMIGSNSILDQGVKQDSVITRERGKDRVWVKDGYVGQLTECTGETVYIGAVA